MSPRSRLNWRVWLLALAAFVIANSAQAQTKIAVVDLLGAMGRTEQGIQAAASIKRYWQSRQAELSRREGELQREQVDLQRQALLLSRRALQRRTEHFKIRYIELQGKALEYNKQLQKKQANLMQPLQIKMLKVVRRAARKRGVDMVIDRNAVPYVRSDLDLTDLVVQMYNSGGGGGSDKKDGKGDKKPEKKPDAPAPVPQPDPAPAKP